MHIFDIRESEVRRVDLPHGGTMYVCFADCYQYPVGFVWGADSGRSVFEVAGSWTEPWCRRQGVRTRINAAIFKDFPTIRTNWGSESGGAAFMKDQGYRFQKEARCYTLA